MRVKYLGSKSFTYILAILIGCVSGLAAVGLKSLISYAEDSIVHGLPLWVFSGLPLAGIFLSYIISRYIFRDSPGYGISSVLYAVARQKGVIPRNKMYAKLVTSAITVSAGGSCGLEAPIVVTGGAIGSNIGRWFHADIRKKSLLIGCGAAAGVAAIFNAPVAGMIFALEVILFELSIASFIPLLLSTVAASVISQVLLGEIAIFNFSMPDEYSFGEIPLWILLGIFLGLVSWYYTRASEWVDPLLQKIRSPFLRAIVGGGALCLLIFLYPPLFGEGYLPMKRLFAANFLDMFNGTLLERFANTQEGFLVMLLAFVLLKVIGAGITLAAGGTGGKFAPAIITGGFAGFFFAAAVRYWFPELEISFLNYTLLGMCGALSGVIHAPLTGIFMIAELTESYTLFVPLMMVSAITYIIKTYFEPYSIYTKKLFQKGDMIIADKDQQVLGSLQTAGLVEKGIITVPVKGHLRDLILAIEQSSRNIFPVVDSIGKFRGIILLDDVRSQMFRHDLYDAVRIRDLMHEPPGLVYLDERMEEVMDKFDRTDAWNLPVVDRDGKYIGILSKSAILTTYRTWLRRQDKVAVE